MLRNKYVKIALPVLVVFLFWLSCIHYTDYHSIAITRNIFNGEQKLDDQSGFNITYPWVQVIRIDVRPYKVCVTTTAKTFNCLLVEFNKDGWREFIETEGFHYVWWNNRFSINFGYDEEYRGMRDLMRGYSYDKVPRSFIKHVKELQ
jgi:hypothetical protein